MSELSCYEIAQKQAREDLEVMRSVILNSVLKKQLMEECVLMGNKGVKKGNKGGKAKEQQNKQKQQAQDKKGKKS